MSKPTQRKRLRANAKRLARLCQRIADGEDPMLMRADALAGATPVSVVDVTTLLRVIAEWNYEIVQPMVTRLPQPPTPGLTDSPAIILGAGSRTLSNLHIIALSGDGINGSNATLVDTLTCSNLVIDCKNYGIYLGSCKHLICNSVTINCDPVGGDSYSIRGAIEKWTSNDGTYRSGIKALRIYGLKSGSSLRDTIEGDRLMLGGGAANEWGTAQPFWNFTFTDGFIDVNSVEIYANTHDVTFTRIDFEGTGHISIVWGAHSIHFDNCLHVPEVKFFNEQGDRYYPTAEQKAARNITGL